jgi:hypothetical protein
MATKQRLSATEKGIDMKNAAKNQAAENTRIYVISIGIKRG